MRTMRMMMLIVVCSAMIGLGGQPEDKAPADSGNYQASCLVKITADVKVLPLRIETVEYLIHSSGVYGRALREVLNSSTDEPAATIAIQEIPIMVSDVRGIGGYYESTLEPMATTASRTIASSDAGGAVPAASSGVASEVAPSSISRTTSRTSARRVSSSAPSQSAGSTGASSSSFSRAATARTRASSFPTLSLDLNDGQQTFLFTLSVTLEVTVEPVAEKFMERVIELLSEAFESTFREYQSGVDAQAELAAHEAERAEKMLLEHQERIRSISRDQDLSRDRVLSDMRMWREKIETLRMEQVSDEAMMEAMANRIDKTRAEIDAALSSDSVSQELESILKYNEQAFALTQEQFKSGVRSESDVMIAKEKVARGRIELAQRREELTREAGGAMLESLNSRLADMMMDRTIARAQLMSYQERLTEAESRLNDADAYELLTLKEEIARQNLQENLVWRDRADRMLRMLRAPAVTVIGGQ